jgi:transposase-like protein
METQGTRTGREEWRKRIERWRDSGLSAEQFAAEFGINAATLKFWKYRIGKETGGGVASKSKQQSAALQAASLVEVQAAPSSEPTPFVLELGKARRLQIPARFDAHALERLLSLLGDG